MTDYRRLPEGPEISDDQIGRLSFELERADVTVEDVIFMLRKNPGGLRKHLELLRVLEHAEHLEPELERVKQYIQKTGLNISQVRDLTDMDYPTLIVNTFMTLQDVKALCVSQKVLLTDLGKLFQVSTKSGYLSTQDGGMYSVELTPENKLHIVFPSAKERESFQTLHEI